MKGSPHKCLIRRVGSYMRIGSAAAKFDLPLSLGGGAMINREAERRGTSQGASIGPRKGEHLELCFASPPSTPSWHHLGSTLSSFQAVNDAVRISCSSGITPIRAHPKRRAGSILSGKHIYSLMIGLPLLDRSRSGRHPNPDRRNRLEHGVREVHMSTHNCGVLETSNNYTPFTITT